MFREGRKAKAVRAVRQLIDFALGYSSIDGRRSEDALRIALRIWKKHNLRGFPTFKRYFYCHNCKDVILPGRTSRIRIRPGKPKSIIVKCLKCGGKYRIPLDKFKRGPNLSYS